MPDPQPLSDRLEALAAEYKGVNRIARDTYEHTAQMAREQEARDSEALARADEFLLAFDHFVKHGGPSPMHDAADAYRATRPNLTPGSASEQTHKQENEMPEKDEQRTAMDALIDAVEALNHKVYGVAGGTPPGGKAFHDYLSEACTLNDEDHESSGAGGRDSEARAHVGAFIQQSPVPAHGTSPSGLGD